MRTVVAYVVAVATTFVLASFLHTQIILNNIAAITSEAKIDLTLRFTQTLADIGGLTISGAVPGLFPGLVGVGLLIAFIAAGFVARLTPSLRWFVFMVAGAVAMLAIFVLLKANLGTVGLFGARGPVGQALQAMAGAIGGLVFSILKPRAE